MANQNEEKSDKKGNALKKGEAKDGEPKVQESGTGFNAVTFLKETREELDKVVWPSRQQLVSESLAVILMVTLSATLIYLVDGFFGWAVKQVF
ncbi:MAG: preprotein translocase subunit SecE [Leptolyngbyaceae cyanobacterium bins.59]|nr:preprotein translocase subunit SecE [Leptolyngbyaceae cyanobacterium bins.59]